MITFVVYVVIIACALQAVRNYRVLDTLIDDMDIKKDALSVIFIEKIMYNSKNPAIRKLQKSIIYYTGIIMLLLMFARM